MNKASAISKKYLQLVQPRLNEVRCWARDGVIEKEIANRLGIGYSTLDKYKNLYMEFMEALKRGKEVYDNEVVDALHKNTLGGIVQLKTPFKCKVKYYENGKCVKEEEIIKEAIREEYVKPDTTAQIYWLNNRQPKYWRNKPESTDREENTLDNLVNAINNIAEMGEEREK